MLRPENRPVCQAPRGLLLSAQLHHPAALPHSDYVRAVWLSVTHQQGLFQGEASWPVRNTQPLPVCTHKVLLEYSHLCPLTSCLLRMPSGYEPQKASRPSRPEACPASLLIADLNHSLGFLKASSYNKRMGHDEVFPGCRTPWCSVTFPD